MNDLPAGPLLTRIDKPFVEYGDRLSRALFRAKASGRLSHSQADYLAVKVLGLHPVCVWSGWFQT